MNFLLFQENKMENFCFCFFFFLFWAVSWFGCFLIFLGFVCLDLKGTLDAQFTQLQQLQDESNPDFVAEVVSLFFEDSEKILNDLTRALWGPLDCFCCLFVVFGNRDEEFGKPLIIFMLWGGKVWKGIIFMGLKIHFSETVCWTNFIFSEK